MPAGEGERVSLGKSLKARGNVEKWLCDVESSMISEWAAAGTEHQLPDHPASSCIMPSLSW